MTQHLPQQPARQMPQVARPHPLYGVTLHELAEDRVDAVAKTAQEGAPSRGGIPFLGRVRSQKLYAHRRQILLRLRRMVVAIPDEQARGSLGDLRHDGKLVGVGRGHRDAGDDPGPADSRVHQV